MNWLLCRDCVTKIVLKVLWKVYRDVGRIEKGVRSSRRQLRSRILLIQKESLIKVSFLRNEHLLANRIVELPCLITLGISNEDTLFFFFF